MKRVVSGIMLTLLLMGTLRLAINIKQVKSTWSGTVYIRADGSINPPNAPIITFDNKTYTLTDNITSSADGIIVERDNIIIDGSGCTVQGSMTYAGKGICISHRKGITIKNVNVKSFDYGIYLYNSYNNSIFRNHISNNNNGILFYTSDNNNVSGNNIMNNGLGICLSYCTHNNILRNNITNNEVCIALWESLDNIISANCLTNNKHGIYLYASYNNSILGNNITNNRSGIGLFLHSSNNSISGNTFINDGLFVYHSYHNSVDNNTVNGEPLIYLEGISDYTISDAGQVVIINCKNIKVENLNLFNTTVGIELWRTSNSTISKNNITNNKYGIYLYQSSSNRIYGNYLKNNGYSIHLYDSFYNCIFGNYITSNGYGIYIIDSSENKFYHNNFINNLRHVYIENLYNYNNVWDCDYPSGGNFWSDYTGVDMYSCPHQNETGSDGVGDTPYSINSDNVDRYPLMHPWSPIPVKVFDVVYGDVHYPFSISSNSSITHFVFNQSLAQISFKLTGDAGKTGYCNITIPKSLMRGPWDCTFEGNVLDVEIFEDENETHSILSFTYKHASTFTVTIKASWVIPEFSFTTLILTMLTLTTLIAIIWKAKGKRIVC